MPPSSKAKTAAAWTTKAASEVGNTAYHALQESLEAAASAAKVLRGDLSPGGRDRLREIDRLVREAQRDLRKSGKHLLAELSSLAEEVASGSVKTTPKRSNSAAAGRATAAKRTPRSATTKAAATRTAPAAKRTTKAKASTARPTTAKRTPKAATTKAAATRTAPAAKRTGEAPATRSARAKRS